jgi:hypothetical protein
VFVWKTYKWVILCLLLTSCPPEDDCWEPVVVSVAVFKADSNIVRSYVYAYGMGLESRKVYPQFYNWYSSKADSSNGVFILELDLHRDECGFCMVKKDQSIDTLKLSYVRHFFADRRCNGYSISGKRILQVSSGFIRDSCYIGETSYYGPEIVLKK